MALIFNPLYNSKFVIPSSQAKPHGNRADKEDSSPYQKTDPRIKRRLVNQLEITDGETLSNELYRDEKSVFGPTGEIARKVFNRFNVNNTLFTVIFQFLEV